MRMFVLAAAAAAAFSLAGVADAQPWTDPAGRLVFDAPAGWRTTEERGAGAGDTFTYVISGTANNECHLISQPNPGLDNVNADSVRRAAGEEARFGSEFWTNLGNGMGQIFPNQSAQFLSRSAETDRFWPIQRADLQSPERVVHASLQLRPGMNLMALCMTYDGAEPMAVYDAVIRSLGHPNDATFQADAELAASIREADAAAPPPEEQPRENRRRNRN